jgi:hypothetical protein
MSQTFINLSKRVINKLYITEITKSSDKYIIHLNVRNFDSFMVSLNSIIRSDYDTIEVCKIKNKIDYEKVTKFINSVD